MHHLYPTPCLFISRPLQKGLRLNRFAQFAFNTALLFVPMLLYVRFLPLSVVCAMGFRFCFWTPVQTNHTVS